VWRLCKSFDVALITPLGGEELMMKLTKKRRMGVRWTALSDSGFSG
jgi:hypothetical protein